MAKQKHAATFLGTQLGLSFVEDRVYGYSGSISVDATQKDLLNFTTGAKALSCKVQFNYPDGDTVSLKFQSNASYYSLVNEYGRERVWKDKRNFGEKKKIRTRYNKN